VMRTPKRFPCGNPGNSGACTHEPAVTRIKEAVSGSCSEQDDKRVRFHLGRPRAAAHSWGKGAHILTENSRIPQPAWSHESKSDHGMGAFGRFQGRTVRFHLPTAPAPTYLTRQSPIGRRI
jgi:hypothetical protein